MNDPGCLHSRVSEHAQTVTGAQRQNVDRKSVGSPDATLAARTDRCESGPTDNKTSDVLAVWIVVYADRRDLRGPTRGCQDVSEPTNL